MSSTNKTANLQLNQWIGTDPVLMADFNADNQKIDAALGGAVRIKVGSYTGNHAVSREIPLGVRPKAVLLLMKGYWLKTDNEIYGGLAVEGGSCETLTLTNNGFTVYVKQGTEGMIYSNMNGQPFLYLALY